MMDKTLFNELSDPELMVLVQSGDSDAFNVLMQRHEDKVFHIAYQIINRKEDARDVAQDVFFKIWQNPNLWEPRALFTTWLYRVTVNSALWKKRGLKLKLMFSVSDKTDDELQLPDVDPTPEERLIRKESLLQLKRGLENLPERQLIAIILRYKEKLTVSEVAEIMKVSVKSAESLLFRAKGTLKKKLSDLL